MFSAPSFSDPPPAALRRVLLVKLSSLGDVVHALPLADALRAALPNAHLAWAVRKKFADLLDGNPNLDAVHTLDASGVRAAARFGRRLRQENFDAALDAQGLLVSGLVTRLSGAKTRVGLDRNREGNVLFLTHAIVPGRQRTHIVEILRGFLPALGLPVPGPVKRQTYLAEGEADKASALLLAQAGARHDAPVVGFIVGASTPDKTWPRERWVELCRRVSDNGARPVLLGGPGEAALAEVIQAEGGGPSVVGSLVGQTPLRVLASVLARCNVAVGGDSGPTHLAVAVGAPVVGLYGVTDPARTGPAWGPDPSLTLDYAEADAPAVARRSRHSTLPDALARIPASAVVEAVETLLRKNF